MSRERVYTKAEAIQSIVSDLTDSDNPLTRLRGPLHGGLRGRHKDKQLALANKIATAVISEIGPDITEGVGSAAIEKKYSKELLANITESVNDYIYTIGRDSGFSMSRTELAEMMGFPESGKETNVPSLIQSMVSAIKQNYNKVLHNSSARSLDAHMEDVSILPAERFSKIGEKVEGGDPGALLEKDGEKFMAKFSRNIDAHGFSNEFLAGPFYKRLMPNRAPFISALQQSERTGNPFDSNEPTLALTSKFIPNFRTIRDIKKSIHKQFKSASDQQIQESNARKEYFKNSIGFEKLMVVTTFLGDWDFKDDNIGLATDKDGRAEWCKVDHAHSFSSSMMDDGPIPMLKSIRKFLLDKGVDTNDTSEWYAYPFVTINLDAFLESIKEITRISDEEIKTIIKHRVDELKLMGVTPSHISSGNHTFEEVEDSYILDLQLRRDGMARLGAMLEVLKSRQANPSAEWKNGDWIRAENAINEIQECERDPEYTTKFSQHYDEYHRGSFSIHNLLRSHNIDLESPPAKFLIPHAPDIQRLLEVGIPFNNIISLNESQLQGLITPASLEFFTNIKDADSKFKQLSRWTTESLKLLFEQAQPAYRMGLLNREEALHALEGDGSIQREVDLGKIFVGTGITKKKMPSEDVIQALIQLPDEGLKFLKSHVNLASLTNEDIPILTANAVGACKDGVTPYDDLITFEKLKQLHQEGPEKFHLLFSDGAMRIYKDQKANTSFDMLKHASMKNLELIVSPEGVDFWLNSPNRKKQYLLPDAKPYEQLKADIRSWNAQKLELGKLLIETAKSAGTFTENLPARRSSSSGPSLSS